MILDFWPPELSELKTAALSDLVYGVLLQWPLGLVQPDQQAVGLEPDLETEPIGRAGQRSCRLGPVQLGSCTVRQLATPVRPNALFPVGLYRHRLVGAGSMSRRQKLNLSKWWELRGYWVTLHGTADPL